MLNELYELSKSLEHFNLLRSITHPDISNVGKSVSLLVLLDKNGQPRGLRYLTKNETVALWKHSKGCHNSFPAIRIQKPLLTESESVRIEPQIWKKANVSEKKALLAGLEYIHINPNCKDIRITDWSLQQLKPVIESTSLELAALRQLLAIFPQKKETQSFVYKTALFLKEHLQFCDNESELDFIQELLIGHTVRKKGATEYVSGCMTYYDLYDVDEYSNLVATAATQRALVQLLNSNNCPANSGAKIISPLSGESITGVGDKYPNPNLPILGLTYLYSKKADMPNLARYGMTGTAAYQVGKGESRAINDALAFLTDNTRRGKTWRPIIDSNKDKANLLLAYLLEYPENDAYLAQLLGDPFGNDSEEERMETERSFEQVCRQLLGNTADILGENQKTRINLLILETLDPGRKQIVYESSLTSWEFYKNIQNWSEAAKNTPPVDIRVYSKSEATIYHPTNLGPNDICQMLKMNYTHSGVSKPTKTSALSLHEVYHIYMPNNVESLKRKQIVERALLLALQKSRYFLMDMGGEMIRHYALPLVKQSHQQAVQAAKFVSIYSILLWMLRIRKEDYMHDASYNLGQLLKLADMLHREYSIQVRNGGDPKKSLPPQLMGNGILTIAVENPIEGLNMLQERMRYYIGWANTTTGKNVGLTKWILKKMGEASLKIAERELPERFTEAEQAQVLLGYLATIQNETTSDKEEKADE